MDLFVRVSNQVAVDMYERLGYSVYRRVLEYYSGEQDEDAFGMYNSTRPVHSYCSHMLLFRWCVCIITELSIITTHNPLFLVLKPDLN